MSGSQETSTNLATLFVMSSMGRGGVKAEAEWHNGGRERHGEEEGGASSPHQGRAHQKRTGTGWVSGDYLGGKFS